MVIKMIAKFLILTSHRKQYFLVAITCLYCINMEKYRNTKIQILPILGICYPVLHGYFVGYHNLNLKNIL
jgi:hypothetical protein